MKRKIALTHDNTSLQKPSKRTLLINIDESFYNYVNSEDHGDISVVLTKKENYHSSRLSKDKAIKTEYDLQEVLKK